MATEAQPARTESHEGMPWWMKGIIVAAVIAAIYLAMPAMIGFFAAYSWIIGPPVAVAAVAGGIALGLAIWNGRERS